MSKHRKKSEGVIVPNNPALVAIRRHTSILSENVSSPQVERRAYLRSIENLKKQLLHIETSPVFSKSLSLQEAARRKRCELDRLGVSF